MFMEVISKYYEESMQASLLSIQIDKYKIVFKCCCDFYESYQQNYK